MSTPLTREQLLRWLLALGCFAAVIFFFSPSWGAFALWARVPELSGMLEVRRGVSVLAQVAHPGAPVADELHRVIQWRLLFPWLGHVLHLPTPLFFGLAHVGCVLVLRFLIGLMRRHGASWRLTGGATIALGAASWFFVATGWLGYFDSWLALALLVVAFAPTSWPVWLACVGAPWIDERFVMAAPLALFCRWLYRNGFSEASSVGNPNRPSNPSRSLNPRWEFGVAAALLAIFLIVRLGLLSADTAANATLVGYFTAKDYLDAPFSRMLLGIWSGLRAGWLFVGAAVWALRATPGRAAGLGIASVAMVGIGLATAQDYSRSMTMLLPVAALGAVAVARGTTGRGTVAGSTLAVGGGIPLAAGAVTLALLLPAHHVMNDRVNPIFYLYHELAAMATPPPTAMPELRELHALHLLEAGHYGEAEAELTLAIKLADNPASPAKQRGRLYASARRWEEAKRDFSLVIENDPTNPDGWFLRSQVELALRENDAARADLEHARAVAPADWAERPDVKRFLALFQQAVPR